MRLLGLALLVLLAGCAAPTEQDEGETLYHSAHNQAPFYPKLLDEMIWESDYIVRATFISAEASTEEVTSVAGSFRPDTIHRPIHKLTFNVHEWIKGSGTSPITVIVRPLVFRTLNDPRVRTLLWPEDKEESQQLANQLLRERDTSYDGRQAILFLIDPSKDWYNSQFMMGDVMDAPPGYVFPQYDYEFRRVWQYHSATSTSRVWLPAEEEEQDGGGGEDSDRMAFTASLEEDDKVTLTGLRTQKQVLETMLASGATIEGYPECVRQKLASERYGRIHVQYNEDLASDVTIESGLAAGTKVKYMLNFDGENYIQWWISGRDVDLFQTVLVDDDSDSNNGYHHGFSTARPLPAGEYLVHYLYHSKDWEPCNYKPEDIYELWTVTVKAPEKTVDEFLFDPAAVGTAVGVNALRREYGAFCGSPARSSWTAYSATIGLT